MIGCECGNWKANALPEGKLCADRDGFFISASEDDKWVIEIYDPESLDDTALLVITHCPFCGSKLTLS